MRLAELLKLVVDDIRLPRSSYEPAVAVLTLRDPKNKYSLGRFQFVMARDPGWVAWLKWFIDSTPGSYRFWPRSFSKFTKYFKFDGQAWF
jgi:hypothetical protein